MKNNPFSGSDPLGYCGTSSWWWATNSYLGSGWQVINNETYNSNIILYTNTQYPAQIDQLKPALRSNLGTIFNSFQSVGYSTILITSGNEYTPQHSPGDTHMTGNAIDIGAVSSLSTDTRTLLRGVLSTALGTNFLVIDETNHFHIRIINTNN